MEGVLCEVLQLSALFHVFYIYWHVLFGQVVSWVSAGVHWVPHLKTKQLVAHDPCEAALDAATRDTLLRSNALGSLKTDMCPLQFSMGWYLLTPFSPLVVPSPIQIQTSLKFNYGEWHIPHEWHSVKKKSQKKSMKSQLTFCWLMSYFFDFKIDWQVQV
jgi:hypothetical protein